ncbi:MAG TPA: MFS transporter [Gammaproteobacteria bacterium]|nr:MFS transporter [Gammaproteobacteria bacterium]
MPTKLPYWRLSGFYFFYFAIVGTLVPYWGPYLHTLGFSARQVGESIAVINLMRVIAPNVLGSLADRHGRRMRLVRLATALSLLSCAAALIDQSYGWLLLVMAVFSFLWNGALPQFEAVTMNHLGARAHRYSRIRLWGSVGFIVAVTVLGGVVDWAGVGIVPYALLLLSCALWLSGQATPERAAPPVTEPLAGFWRVLWRPEVLGFLFAAFLSQMSHGPYYAFFSIYLQEHGYRSDTIGLLWAWAVIAEIGVFMAIHSWLPRHGPRRLMLAALLLGALRWLVIGGFPNQLALLFAAQTLHAASFGIYHAVGIAVVSRFFRGRSQGRGQAIYSSMTFGAGVAIGSLAAGYLWAGLGGSGVFYLASAVSALAAVIAWRTVPPSLQVPAAQH